MIEKVTQRLEVAGLAEELAYQEFTSNVTVSATAEATPNDVVAAPAIALDGTTTILVEFYTPLAISGTTASSYMLINLWDDTTNLGYIGVAQRDANVSGGAPAFPISASRKLTPAAGTHTYKIRAFRAVANGTIYGGVGGSSATYNPGYIRVTRLSGATILSPNRGTSLPGSPLDGQLYTLVDSLTNPTYEWTFRYNAASASTYKWEYISGAPLMALASQGDTYSTLGAWNFTTGSPSVTIPRAGDWLTVAFCGITNNAATANNSYMGLGKNATVDPSLTEPGVYFPAVNTIDANIYTQDNWVALAQSDVLKMSHYLTAGSVILGAPTVRGRSISLLPKRVI